MKQTQEIVEKRNQLVQESKDSGLYNFCLTTVQENKTFIKNTLKKHGKKSWLKSWLVNKLNVNNEELEKFLPREKHSIVFTREKIEFIVPVEQILKDEYGVE